MSSPPVPPAAQLAAPPESHAPGGAAPSEDDSERIERLDGELAEAATHGMLRLQHVWTGIPAADKPMLEAAKNRRHKPAAAKADEEAGR